MPSQKPKPQLTQAFDDMLARMMQAEVNEGGPPPATPRDTPVEVIAKIHMKDPVPSPAEIEDGVHTTKTEFVKKLNEQLEGLREEIHEMRRNRVALNEAALAKWCTAIADIEARQRVAREKLDTVTTFTGEAWEHLRDAAKHAWNELEQAVRKARSGF